MRSAPLVLLLAALTALGATPSSDDDAITVTRRPWQSGERFELSAVAEVKLEAEIGSGFLSQRMSYDIREEERLEVSVREPGDDGRPRMDFAYPVRRNTTVAPIVGRKVKDRRVAGKSYHVVDGDDGPAVLDDDGNDVREKEALHVRASYSVVGRAPTLFALLPADGVLHPGQELTADGPLARSLLGLPIEELVADTLVLRVQGLDEQGALVLQASAHLGGQKELAGRDVRLSVDLAGPYVIDPASGRLLRMELTGTATIVADSDDALLAARGEGTLVLRRMMRPLDG